MPGSAEIKRSGVQAKKAEFSFVVSRGLRDASQLLLAALVGIRHGLHPRATNRISVIIQNPASDHAERSQLDLDIRHGLTGLHFETGRRRSGCAVHIGHKTLPIGGDHVSAGLHIIDHESAVRVAIGGVAYAGFILRPQDHSGFSNRVARAGNDNAGYRQARRRRLLSQKNRRGDTQNERDPHHGSLFFSASISTAGIIFTWTDAFPPGEMLTAAPRLSNAF